MSKLKAWEKQEKSIAKLLSGKRQRGSGCSKWALGDIISDTFLVEAKETSKPYIDFRLVWLSKIKKEASVHNKVPLFCVELGNGERMYFIPSIYATSVAPVSISNEQIGKISFRLYFGGMSLGEELHSIDGKWTYINEELLSIIQEELEANLIA